MACFSSFVPFALLVVHGIQRECPLYFRRENNREIRENREQKKEASPGTLDLTKKGVSLVDLKRFEEESKESFHHPSREGPESREGKRGPRSRRSRCSRFMIFNRRVRSNFNRENRENREQKRSVRFSSNRETRESREKFYSLYFLVRTLRVVRGS